MTQHLQGSKQVIEQAGVHAGLNSWQPWDNVLPAANITRYPLGMQCQQQYECDLITCQQIQFFSAVRWIKGQQSRWQTVATMRVPQALSD
jgi:hypothetical protein